MSKSMKVAKELVRLAKQICAGERNADDFDFDEEIVFNSQKEGITKLKQDTDQDLADVDDIINEFANAVVKYFDKTFKREENSINFDADNYLMNYSLNLVSFSYHTTVQSSNDEVRVNAIIVIEQHADDKQKQLIQFPLENVIRHGGRTFILEDCAENELHIITPSQSFTGDFSGIYDKLQKAMENWMRTKMAPAMKKVVREYLEGLNQQVAEKMGEQK